MAKTGRTARNRIRIGLAGLTMVVSLVLSGTMFVSTQPQKPARAMAQESLAVLGLAPASSPHNPATTR
jgi:hypothetical protein